MRVRLKQPELLALLAQSRLSQNHWALKVGISRGHWSAIVNGKHPYPSAKTRALMLDAFKVPLDELFEVEVDAPWADVDVRRGLADRYLIDAELGQGGMGAVYLARDVRHGRSVAVKVIADEAVEGIGVEQFLHEIAIVAKLQHPHVLTMHDSGLAAGSPFYVMPFIAGGSLRRRLESERRLPLDVATALTRGIAAGLHYAHGQQVLHCDIKPENILLDGDHPYVMDFGIARKLHSEAIHWRAQRELDLSAGTPAYVSPEQASGERELDPRSDVYSLACVAYEMLTGRTPFEGRTTALVISRRFVEPPPALREYAPELPWAVEDCVLRALALEPARRPVSTVQFAAELAAAAVQGSRALSRVSVTVTRVLAARVPASRAARRRIGRTPHPTPRIGRLVTMAGSFARDLRDASRGLLRAPAVTVSAVLCLGLGLGATAAISSAIDAALLQPLPFREPERLVTVYRTTPQFDTGPFSAPNYTDLAAGSKQIAALAAATPRTWLLSLPEQAVRVSVLRVTGNAFGLLGVTPAYGRMLAPADDTPDASPVVVISDELWRRELGADPAAVGRSVILEGTTYTVVGVLPHDFRVPHGGVLKADVWAPMRFSTDEMSWRSSNWLMTFGRLAPGATVASAHAELRTLFNGIAEAYPDLQGEQVRVLPLQEEGSRAVRTPLLLLGGAVIFVLLIAATNVASLLLARGLQRRREMAIRTAIGGGRWAVMRPVLLESLLLSVAGVMVGLGLATLGVRTIGVVAAERLPQLAGLSIDLRVVGFAVALSVVVALLCGAVPAWRSARVDPQEALRGGTGGGAGLGHHRALAALVTLEVALSLVLLLGAGLVLRGFASLVNRPPGFEATAMLALNVTITPDAYPDNSSAERFLEPALAAVRRVPGVAAAGAINLLPYESWGWNFNVRYEGQSDDNRTQRPLVERRVVAPEFFAVTQQRLIAGRLLEARDGTVESAPSVVVVNEALAKRDFPGQDAVGKRFYRGNGFTTIVGVVSDIRNVGPVLDPRAEAYWTYRQDDAGATGFSFVVRTSGVAPGSVARAVTAAIREVDSRAAVSDVRPMTDVIAGSVGRPRFFLSLLGVFAGVALLLAMAGLYGVMSYTVAQRTREIGIRAALGSSPRSTVRHVAGRGLQFVAAGVVLGLVGAVFATKLLQSLLYGISPLDVSTWVIATVALVGAGVAATLVPARRAARVDPLIAMRAE